MVGSCQGLGFNFDLQVRVLTLILLSKFCQKGAVG